MMVVILVIAIAEHSLIALFGRETAFMFIELAIQYCRKICGVDKFFGLWLNIVFFTPFWCCSEQFSLRFRRNIKHVATMARLRKSIFSFLIQHNYFDFTIVRCGIRKLKWIWTYEDCWFEIIFFFFSNYCSWKYFIRILNLLAATAKFIIILRVA